MMEDSEEAAFAEDQPDVETHPTGLGNGGPDCETRIDCAEIAAAHLLGRALGKSAGPPRPGLYVLIAPADAWCPVLARIARKVLLRIPRHGLKRAVLTGTEPAVSVVEFRPQSVRGSVGLDAQEAVEAALAEGQLAVVIGSSRLAVPPSLRRAADRVVHVPAPDRRCVAALLRAVAPAGRRPSMRNLGFAAIGPASLRLAYRPGASGGDYVRRLRAVAQTPRSTAPNLNRLHGVNEVKRWASELKSDLEAWRLGRIGWNEVARGLLLAGPPGTGKTTLAAAIAEHAGMTFVATSYAAWQGTGSGHLGDVVTAMAASFNEARQRAPSLHFIDELDTLVARGVSGARPDWWRSVINALLEQMDGTINNEGVILVAATNHPDHIDPAILRAGRLEDRIDVGPPDTDALACIYADQLQGRLKNGVDLERLALMSVGLTGADVVRICKMARRSARHEGRLVTDQDLMVALGGDVTGADPRELSRVAIHESGHAVVGASFPALRLGDISIVGRGDSAGRASVSVPATGVMTGAVLDALLAALLAGRAAEEVLLADVSAGAGGAEESDLSRATQLATMTELSLGMGSQGVLWYPRLSSAQLVALFGRRPDLEAAVQHRLNVAYATAKTVVEANAPMVRLLAERLVVRKAMAAEEIKALLDSARATPVGAIQSPAIPDGGSSPSIQ